MSTLTFTIKEISDICNAQLVQEGSDPLLTHIITDSRHIGNPSNTLFIAISGDKHNGHSFVEEAFQKGIRAFLISEPLPFVPPNATILKVNDTLLAFQKIATAHRSKFNIPVVAISGSNGKTIVKEWLTQMLSPEYSIVNNPGSFNSQIGVPLSVCLMGTEHRLGIFEAGISKPGEMERLEKIIQPQIGIFTNIGPAHDENFINTGQKVAEKLNLFVNCKDLIYCSDYYEISKKLYSSGLAQKIKLFSWGKGPDNTLQILQSNNSGQHTFVKYLFEGTTHTAQIPFADMASMENAIHCIALMLLQGYEPTEINKRLALLTPVKMRLELKEGINNTAIINDSYNSDINSLSIALDFLEKNKRYDKKTLILSDILQSGKNAEALASEIADLITSRNVDRFIGIGNMLSEMQKQFTVKSSFYKNTDDFITHFDPASFHDEIILLKGARKFEFERISRLLESKVHHTVLEINLNALTENLNYFKSKLNKNTRIMVMVKAFAYGSGVFEIAGHLQYHRVDYLAVAYTDEGIDLRKAGINIPVMVMSPEEDHLYLLLKYKLEPEIYSFRLLNKLIETLLQWKDLIKEPLPIHLKFDTGMHRLGFVENDIDLLAEMINKYSHLIKVASVFSHFSASDEMQYDDFTNQQIDRYSPIVDKLHKLIGYNFIKHISNSAAALRFPNAKFDMVRIGIGLYGVDESSHNAALANVLSFKTRIIQLHDVAAGESVGYSRKSITDKNRRIATLSVGYADGFHRIMGNGNWQVLLHGQKAAIAGNICMDMCMIDVSHIPEAKEGDEVLIFGEGNPLSDYSNAMKTIAYEALTSISQRGIRIYVQHGN